jgi:cyclopropane fatty-acyl-phospholipid synthase-like methyltransferase
MLCDVPDATASADFGSTPTGGWGDPEQVQWYTSRIGRLEARLAGEAVLRDLLPPAPERVLDLGCGDGRLAGLVLDACPSVVRVIAADRSEPMLEQARARFAGDDRVSVVRHDLDDPVDFGTPFDVIVSGFAIHHVGDERKRALFGELRRNLEAGGSFLNLEVVASSTPRRHQEFLVAIGRTADDPEDRLAPIGDQLAWMSDAGFVEAECVWRWRGFALMVAEAPT